MTEQQQQNGGTFFLILGFIFKIFDLIFENMETFDLIFGVVLKFTSLISFFLFLLLNWPKIKGRFVDVYKYLKK